MVWVEEEQALVLGAVALVAVSLSFGLFAAQLVLPEEEIICHPL